MPSCLPRNDSEDNRGQWDKSRIVEDLVTKSDVSRQTARTIASMVEEKIFNIGITLVPASLIKQLVLKRCRRGAACPTPVTNRLARIRALDRTAHRG